jgi:hypothetical protein
MGCLNVGKGWFGKGLEKGPAVVGEPHEGSWSRGGWCLFSPLHTACFAVCTLDWARGLFISETGLVSDRCPRLVDMRLLGLTRPSAQQKWQRRFVL